MEYTMLNQLSRRGIVEATFREDNKLNLLYKVIDPPQTSGAGPLRLLSRTEEGDFFARGTTALTHEEYTRLFLHLQAAGRPYHSVNEEIIANGCVRYLPPYVHMRTEVFIGDRTFSSRGSHNGNSAIQFVNPRTQRQDTGYIEKIWTIPLDSTLQTFFLVHSH